MKGRAPTADEDRHMSAVQALGCIICKKWHQTTTPGEIHHTDGKTKPGAHFKIICLCVPHHRAGHDCLEYTSRHPWKKRFESRYATEQELIEMTMELLRNENSDRITCSSADLESDISDAAFSEDRIKAQDSRVNITVRSYRKLNSDPDGVSAKAAIDGIVARGILPDDSSEQIKSVTFETIKSKEEKTIIEIIQLDNKIP